MGYRTKIDAPLPERGKETPVPGQYVAKEVLYLDIVDDDGSVVLPLMRWLQAESIFPVMGCSSTGPRGQHGQGRWLVAVYHLKEDASRILAKLSELGVQPKTE